MTIHRSVLAVVVAVFSAGCVTVLAEEIPFGQNMNKAIDEVRAAEVKRLKADGYEPVLSALALVPVEEAGELDREADGETLGAA